MQCVYLFHNYCIMSFMCIMDRILIILIQIMILNMFGNILTTYVHGVLQGGM